MYSKGKQTSSTCEQALRFVITARFLAVSIIPSAMENQEEPVGIRHSYRHRHRQRWRGRGRTSGFGLGERVTRSGIQAKLERVESRRSTEKQRGREGAVRVRGWWFVRFKGEWWPCQVEMIYVSSGGADFPSSCNIESLRARRDSGSWNFVWIKFYLMPNDTVDDLTILLLYIVDESRLGKCIVLTSSILTRPELRAFFFTFSINNY